jgi:hypothetical protein
MDKQAAGFGPPFAAPPTAGDSSAIKAQDAHQPIGERWMTRWRPRCSSYPMRHCERRSGPRYEPVTKGLAVDGWCALVTRSGDGGTPGTPGCLEQDTGRCQGARGTTLVPNASSITSRSSANVDALDDLDAHGRIDTLSRSAGGRKIAGSNPVASTIGKPASEAGFRRVRCVVQPVGDRERDRERYRDCEAHVHRPSLTDIGRGAKTAMGLSSAV